MINAWQFASLPIWVVGFIFVGVAIAIGLGVHHKPGETQTDKLGQCGVGLVLGIPFLILAAWMWH